VGVEEVRAAVLPEIRGEEIAEAEVDVAGEEEDEGGVVDLYLQLAIAELCSARDNERHNPYMPCEATDKRLIL
jgi:hypothetical protein